MTKNPKKQTQQVVGYDNGENEIVFGISLYMGLRRAGSIRDYWWKSIIYKNEFCKFMS